jgi:hypothetical protein
VTLECDGPASLWTSLDLRRRERLRFSDKGNPENKESDAGPSHAKVTVSIRRVDMWIYCFNPASGYEVQA